eukprot:TRINITY_DN3257_c0_g1_i15.p1 TRINITY_DN3257_c0_g1~~TRINITY_DN3257_c0_g1_i15.p1  ORF type:complete len:430 (-),score=83.37 TRINITY_DN3257_c0_g1_i15:357-1646(-)
MYTSGSNGIPKGVLCTHSNCMASVGGVVKSLQLFPGDVHLSYLPLAHVFAFVVELVCLSKGVSIAYGNSRSFSDRSVRNCLGDISEARPSFLVGVPSVYHTLKAGIMEEVEKFIRPVRHVFDMAYEWKKKSLKMGTDTPILNKLFFGRFGKVLGGKVRFILSGGSPLSRECGEFMRICFGVPVLQGYGLTETVAGGAIGEMDDMESHLNIGPPVCSTEIKLLDCPELGYTHHDDPEPRGEICVRGPHVSSGYLKKDSKRRDFMNDGWFKTGDIGRLNRNGTISLIDRKKNLVKPPHGEYVTVERLESTYKNCPFVENILIHASSHHNQIVALIFPNAQVLEEWADKHNIDETWVELCSNSLVEKAVLKSLNDTWKKTNLLGFERISAVKLYHQEWNTENGWLTPTFKVRRQKIEEQEKHVIEELYKQFL